MTKYYDPTTGKPIITTKKKNNAVSTKPKEVRRKRKVVGKYYDPTTGKPVTEPAELDTVTKELVQEQRRIQSDVSRLGMQISQAQDTVTKLDNQIEALEQDPFKYQIQDPETGKWRPIVGRDIDKLKTQRENLKEWLRTAEAAIPEYEEYLTELAKGPVTTWTVGDKTFDTEAEAKRWAAEHPTWMIPGIDKVFKSEQEAYNYLRGLEAAAAGPPPGVTPTVVEGAPVVPPGMVLHLGTLMTREQFERDFPPGTVPSGPIYTPTGITSRGLGEAWEGIFAPISTGLSEISGNLAAEAVQETFKGKPWRGFIKYLASLGVDVSRGLYEIATFPVRPKSWAELAQGVSLILTPSEPISWSEHIKRLNDAVMDIEDPSLRKDALNTLTAMCPYQPISEEQIRRGKEYRAQLGAEVVRDPFRTAVNIATGIVGGWAYGKLLSRARSALEAAAIKRTRGTFKLEDYYCPDELMWMEKIRYPEAVSSYETFTDMYMVKVKAPIVSALDESKTVPWDPKRFLIHKKVPEGMLYKMGVGEYGYDYGFLQTGGDFIPVLVPKGVGEIKPMYKPVQVRMTIDWIKHHPGVITDLEGITMSGVRLPSWVTPLVGGLRSTLTTEQIVEEFVKRGIPERKVLKILPEIRMINDFTIKDVEKITEALKDKDVPDIKTVLFEMADARIEPIQAERVEEKMIQEELAVEEEEEELVPPGLPPYEPSEVPEIEEPIPPIIPMPEKEPLEKKKKKELPAVLEPYLVVFDYYTSSDRIRVKAKSFGDACRKAERDPARQRHRIRWPTERVRVIVHPEAS